MAKDNGFGVALAARTGVELDRTLARRTDHAGGVISVQQDAPHSRRHAQERLGDRIRRSRAEQAFQPIEKLLAAFRATRRTRGSRQSGDSDNAADTC